VSYTLENIITHKINFRKKSCSINYLTILMMLSKIMFYWLASFLYFVFLYLEDILVSIYLGISFYLIFCLYIIDNNLSQTIHMNNTKNST